MQQSISLTIRVCARLSDPKYHNMRESHHRDTININDSTVFLCETKYLLTNCRVEFCVPKLSFRKPRGHNFEDCAVKNVDLKSPSFDPGILKIMVVEQGCLTKESLVDAKV